MPDSPIPQPSGNPPVAVKGKHDEFIKKSIPDHLITLSPARRKALKGANPETLQWYSTVTAEQRVELQKLVVARIKAQGKLDKTMGKILPLTDFARPLLEAALKDLGHTMDVNEVYLRLYSTVENDDFGVSEAFNVRTLSLLQAALHNFEEVETGDGHFTDDCGFISRPDEQGHFKPYVTLLSIQAFVQLCRSLDLGTLYQTYLKTFLDSKSEIYQSLLQSHFIDHHKSVLMADAYVAMLKGDITVEHFKMLLVVISGPQPVRIEGKPVWYRSIRMWDMTLRGCVVFEPRIKFFPASWIIVWIPGDPYHPLKYYSSHDAFQAEMKRKLTPERLTVPRSHELTAYQQFLSQFIDQSQHPEYYNCLTELFTHAPPPPVVLPGGTVTDEDGRWSIRANSPIDLPAFTSRVLSAAPAVNASVVPLNPRDEWYQADLWQKLLEGMIKKTLADGRSLAISTEDADAAYLVRRTSHYFGLFTLVLNTLSFVVPELGLVMLGAMAVQLLHETIEGIVEWSAGDVQSAWEHLSDVIENLAIAAAGGVLLHVGVNPLIENLKTITLLNGKTRLWKPELAPYERSQGVPPNSRANDAGLHVVGEQEVLPHEGKHYELNKDPVTGEYRTQHPTRSDAYQPVFRHNGEGVWVNETEQPLTWSDETLRQRLGTVTEGFSDAEFRQALRISDVSFDDLRRMYVENEPIPAALKDTLKRYAANSKARGVGPHILAGRMPRETCTFAVTFTLELPRWPQNVAFEVYEVASPLTTAKRFGNAQATGADVIKISDVELMSAKLPERVVDRFSRSELEQLLGESVPFEEHERVQLFREKLAAHASDNAGRLFESIFNDVIPENDPDAAALGLIQRAYPRLTTSRIRGLLADASPAEKAVLQQGKIPMKLGLNALHVQRAMRIEQAYLGLYLDEMVTADTEILVMNSLEALPGWKDDLRLEVRDGNRDGTLRSQYGAENASQRKVLVRDADGRYETFDSQGQSLHGQDDFIASLQYALPDAHRTSIGLPHTGQGEALKVLIREHAIARSRLRQLLKIPPDELPFFKSPVQLSPKRSGYPLSGRGVGEAAAHLKLQALKERFRALYPEKTVQRRWNPASPDIYTDFLEFQRVHGEAVEEKISLLEQEFRQMDASLNQWIRSPINDQPLPARLSQEQQRVIQLRQHIRKTLTAVWQKATHSAVREAGRELGFSINFEDVPGLGEVLGTLPPLEANFDHVRDINLNGTGVTDSIDGFLSNFERIRSLQADKNRLTRLPEALGSMRNLAFLVLTEGTVQLTESSIAALKELTLLEHLGLSLNPLGLAPDISRMPALEVLELAQCEQRNWPTGLFDQPRPETFSLNLTANELTSIPDVEPGSDQARTLARTRLSRHRVSDAVLEKYNAYKTSVGIDPERINPPSGVQGRRQWTRGPGVKDKAEKQALWDRLEQAHGSEPFFNELARQGDDLRNRPDDFKRNMETRVWQMLEVMDESVAVREKLFTMANAPITCTDAGLQVFNAMGVEVLLYEALRLEPINLALSKLELFNLARGRARLDQLSRIARARVRELVAQGRPFPKYDAQDLVIPQFDAQGNQLKTIDEVEIHLAYTTLLAKRLDLPWQLEMFFAEPDVTPVILDAAYSRVLALEEGEGLRNQMIKIPFWREFIERTNSARFAALDEKALALFDYQSDQKTLGLNSQLPALAQRALRKSIDAAARHLGIAPADVVYGRAMTDLEYDAMTQSFLDEKDALMKLLTDQVAGRQAT
ncbi:dermonecrotic toxin domain-containing protein [Pseudomonas helleri]|uniref:dermonecrotic toxin domain-containing protein n=1 Tax=Pseudomonas helleri TaxID=1608996 RepID=UPI0028EF835E|nr:DUF6543 domain-containing protein [Pseudomonas helleri]